MSLIKMQRLNSASLELLANINNWQERLSLAKHPLCPSSLLIRFSTDEELEVRLAVARNPMTPRIALEQLACDKAPQVRRAVAWNLRTPESALLKLSQDNFMTIRCMVLVRICNNPEVFSNYFFSRLIQETNPQFVRRVLQKLLQEGSSEFVQRLLKHVPLPLWSLQLGLQGKNRHIIRQAVLQSSARKTLRALRGL